VGHGKQATKIKSGKISRIHKSHFCPPLTHHNLTATATTPNSSTSTSTTIPTTTHNTALSLLTNLPPPPLHEH